MKVYHELRIEEKSENIFFRSYMQLEFFFYYPWLIISLSRFRRVHRVHLEKSRFFLTKPIKKGERYKDQIHPA